MQQYKARYQSRCKIYKTSNHSIQCLRLHSKAHQGLPLLNGSFVTRFWFSNMTDRYRGKNMINNILLIGIFKKKISFQLTISFFQCFDHLARTFVNLWLTQKDLFVNPFSWLSRFPSSISFFHPFFCLWNV